MVAKKNTNKHTNSKKITNGDYEYKGQNKSRGSVKCSTCRGGEMQRYKCSLTGATPISGCVY